MLSPHADGSARNNPLARLVGLGLRFRSTTDDVAALAKVHMTSPSSTAPEPVGRLRPRSPGRRGPARFRAHALSGANWVPPVDGPDGKPALDVLVIGAGMCGQTLALALARDGVRNCGSSTARRAVAKALGHLRAHGHPALAQAPDRPRPRLPRAHLSRLVRGAARRRGLGPALQDRHRRLAGLSAVGAGYGRHRGRERHRGSGHRSWTGPRPRRAAGPRAPRPCTREKSCWPEGETARARLTCRRSRRWPAHPRRGGRRVFHSSDDIDFARFKGGRIGVLGASASAFDNAAVALEAGAAEVRLFSRRPHLPQINKSKWASFPGSSMASAISTTTCGGRSTPTSSPSRRRRRTSRCCAATATPASPSTSPRRGSTWSRGRRRHGRHRQGPVCVRCRDHGDGLRRRSVAAARARAHP